MNATESAADLFAPPPASTGGLGGLSAGEIASLVGRGELTAEEVTRATLARIAKVDPLIHAFTHVAEEAALRQARVVDAKVRAKQPVGRFAGVPVGVKDVFNTAEMPTEMGSPIWKGFTPGNDARVVFQLRFEGAVFPGKTVTAEFAVHTPGATKNPHDPEHMPGTSSSGSAAAVAARLVPVALGTQTAGSIIRPASYCGIYGFKPSFGLVPRTGMLKTTDSLDTVGFFARNASDLRLLFEVARVHGRDYPIAHAALSDERRQKKGDRKWRIGILENPPKWELAEDYAKKAFDEYVARLERVRGVEVVRVRLPAPFYRAHEVHGTIYDKTLSYYFKDEFAKKTLISPVMYEIISRGQALSLDAYRAALAEQDELARTFDDMMRACDGWLTLSTGGAALKGLHSVDRPDSCLVWTLCGAPVASLPVFSKDHLPFGAQLVGRKYNDLLLLDLAAFLEEELGDAGPPVPALARD